MEPMNSTSTYLLTLSLHCNGNWEEKQKTQENWLITFKNSQNPYINKNLQDELSIL